MGGRLCSKKREGDPPLLWVDVIVGLNNSAGWQSREAQMQGEAGIVPGSHDEGSLDGGSLRAEWGREL